MCSSTAFTTHYRGGTPRRVERREARCARRVPQRSPGKGVDGRRLRCGPRPWPRRSGPLGPLAISWARGRPSGVEAATVRSPLLCISPLPNLPCKQRQAWSPVHCSLPSQQPQHPNHTALHFVPAPLTPDDEPLHHLHQHPHPPTRTRTTSYTEKENPERGSVACSPTRLRSSSPPAHCCAGSG
jgi:hypothetical protein